MASGVHGSYLEGGFISNGFYLARQSKVYLYAPNWVHILCSKLGTHSLHPIRCMNSVPNWVPISIYQQGICLRKPNLDYRLCSKLGTLWFAPNWVQ